MKLQKKILIGLALTLIIVIFIPLYWATEPGRQESARQRQKAEAVERGAKLYALQCAACHGSQGEGGIATALKDSLLDENVLERTIARGIPGTVMPAFDQEEGGSLKRHQIQDLVTFIKNWESAMPPKPAPESQPTLSAKSAGELYATSCAACHGANRGGMSGLGPALTPESLAALSDAEILDAALNGVPGTMMPAFKSILSAEEIDALLQFIKYTSP